MVENSDIKDIQEERKDFWEKEYAKAKLLRDNNIERLAIEDVEIDIEKKSDPAYFVEAKAQHRKNELDAEFPTLQQKDFASETEYKQALITQYGNLRNQHYEYVCYNEGVKAYYLARDITNSTGNRKQMNIEIWSDCRSFAEKYKDRAVEISDSCYARVNSHVTNTLNNSRNENLNCCAVTSKALISQVSAEMGYDNENNFIKPQHGNNAYFHRGANGFLSDPNNNGYIRKGNLWDLIEEGKVGVGSGISKHVGQASNTSSGYHVLTVIGIERDEKGKLVNYTLQGNNNTSLSVMTANSKHPNVSAADTNAWMQERIHSEQEQMANMTVEQIQTRIAQEKKQTENTITELQKTEKNLFEGKGNVAGVKKIGQQYIASFSDEEKQLAMEEFRRSPSYQEAILKEKMKYSNKSYEHIMSEAQKRLHPPYTEKDIYIEDINKALSTNVQATASEYRNSISKHLKMGTSGLMKLDSKERAVLQGTEAKAIYPSRAMEELEAMVTLDKNIISEIMKEDALQATLEINSLDIPHIKEKELASRKNDKVSKETAQIKEETQQASISPNAQTSMLVLNVKRER